ncbi:MAG: carboxypeptidase M32 [Anaerolineales bacterium]|nr:carboxypeptidase M32 [Anaerolineales bacterium]
MENLNALKARTAEVVNLNRAASVLSWDQQTYMPPGGAEARAEQMATLRKYSHQVMTADETGRLLEAAEQEVAGLDEHNDEVGLVRIIRRDYDRATKLPSEHVVEFSKTTTIAHETWVKARAEDNFALFLPTLEKIYDLCRQRAEYLGYQDQLYDALLDQYEAGATTAEVEALFSNLREELVPFVAAILERADQVSGEPLHRAFPADKQAQFGLMAAQKMGYDMRRGRQDLTVHPFCITFSRDDVRITTRYDENFLSDGLFSTLHEAGHAIYEQGIPARYDGTPLGRGVSLGVHESQSRLWENIVGRSRGFWRRFYGELQQTFAGVLDDVSVEDFYRAINRVSASYIRVDADEVTYPLHIMLRFELEQDIFNGKLAVKDAPEAWNAKMEAYLGIRPRNNAEGVLQDVHWSSGIMGYFPTYAMGTMLSAQLYNAALADHSGIPAEIEQGEFSTLLQWMNTHVHAYGRKYMPADVVVKATGQPLQHHAYMNYLRAKFGEIYGL